MSEIRDAKYFGAKIGDKCWLDGNPFEIFRVSKYYNWFTVDIGFGIQELTIKNGEGITFEPPKKKVKKEIDCFLVENKSPDSEKYSIFWSKEQFYPGYRDELIPAKLSFEIME